MQTWIKAGLRAATVGQKIHWSDDLEFCLT